eukprot:TRINITY_DN2243_c0_g1_i1.p1 TRINITY_DN2243_c0_g1~~TRINITY_DN2243_c0_g1_i1.p1  ORF type:complete len:200 (+),score=90.75 TRINITY_DN2243_c0_g1_i1:389-988(+)
MQTVKNLQKSIKKTLKKVNNLKDNIVLSLKVREVSVLSKHEVQSNNEEVPPPPPAPAAFVSCPQRINITKAKVSPVKKEENDFQSELKNKLQQRTLVMKDAEQFCEVKAESAKSVEVTTPVVAQIKIEVKAPVIQSTLKGSDVPPPPPPPPAVAVPKRTVTTQQPMKREPAAKVIQNLDLISELKNVQMRKRQPIPVNM